MFEWLTKRKKIESLEHSIHTQFAINNALFQQMHIYQADLSYMLRSYKKRKGESKLSEEIIDGLEGYLARFEQ